MAPHLLTLPGEIKNRIYEFCIDEEVTIEISSDKPLGSITQWRKAWTITTFEGRPEEQDGDCKEFALMKTCRQIRFEVLPILAKLGHSCLYVPLYGHFNAQMIAPLPQAFLGNIRQLRLWKTRPTLKDQTLTPALPALESLVLELKPQKLGKHLGARHRYSWTSWHMTSRRVHEKLEDLVSDIYERESNYLAETEPNRIIALDMRVPYGSFSVPIRGNRTFPCIESDHTLVSGTEAPGQQKLTP